MKKIPLLPTPMGCFVKIEHLHDPRDLANCRDTRRGQSPRYVTYARLYEEGASAPSVTAAAFCSHKDTPSRKMGRAIAHNRAVSYYNRQLLNSEVAA